MTGAVLLAAALLACRSGPRARRQPHARDAALAGLRNADDVEARRRGARDLAESGPMADLSVLAQALRVRQHRARIRRSPMWSVWSRSGDDEVDKLFHVGVMQLSDRRFVPAVRTSPASSSASRSSPKAGTSGPPPTSCWASSTSRSPTATRS